MKDMATIFLTGLDVVEKVVESGCESSKLGLAKLSPVGITSDRWWMVRFANFGSYGNFKYWKVSYRF